MKRSRVALAVLGLALVAAASGWRALRGRAAGERSAAPSGAPAAPDVRPAAELAAPENAATFEGEPAAAQRVAVGSAESDEKAVIIQDARGSPAAHVQWVVFRGADVLASGATAADGVAAFARGAGSAELAAAAPGHPPQVFAVDLAQDGQVAALAAGAAVSGTVLLDGSPPQKPFDLELRIDFPEDALPPAVWQAIGWRGWAGRSLTVTTDAQGAFAFGGLPQGWTGNLSWSGPFDLLEEEPDARAPLFSGTWEASSETWLAVEAPVEDLLVRLESTPLIKGSVVMPDTGQPIPRAGVSLAWSDDFGIGSTSTVAEPDGTFAIPVLHRLPTRIEITVADPERTRARRRTLDIPPGLSTYDTGALATSPLRTVAFVVRDIAGVPIAGADISEVPAPAADGAAVKADAEGRGELEVMPDTHALRAAAFGYASAEVELPPGAEPLTVVLRPVAVLVVRLAGESQGLGVKLFGDEAPFTKDGEPNWLPDPRPPGAISFSSGAGKGFATFNVSEDGSCVLTGIRPRLALTLAVVDAFGLTLEEQPLFPFFAGERRVVELAPAPPTRKLAGRVLSADHVPVRGAEVSIGEVGSQDMIGCLTDAEGRFRWEGLAAERVRLAVTHAKGHAPLLLPDQPVTDEPPLELVLERGRTVRVVVHGPDGSKVPGAAASLSMGLPRWTLLSRATSEGIVFENAPSEALDLIVTVGGRRIERSLAPGSEPEEVDIEVPPWQRCTVHLSGLQEDRELSSIHLEGPGGLQMRSPGKSGGDAVRFDVVFPGHYEVFAVAWIEGREERWSETLALEVTSSAPASATLELRRP